LATLRFPASDFQNKIGFDGITISLSFFVLSRNLSEVGSDSVIRRFTLFRLRSKQFRFGLNHPLGVMAQGEGKYLIPSWPAF
jgi:hypothetical protein